MSSRTVSLTSPRAFFASHMYAPFFCLLMLLRVMLFFDPTTFWSPSSLDQVYVAGGLASLLQVRVTELPSGTRPEGLTDTEGCPGASGEKHESIIYVICRSNTGCCRFLYLYTRNNTHFVIQSCLFLSQKGTVVYDTNWLIHILCYNV